jgi:hypothetical protein
MILGRMNAGKKQVEYLMNELLGFAERMLDEHGAFHPFGGYLKPSGAIIHVGVQSSRYEEGAAEG